MVSPKYRILSLDGGGIRGVVQAVLIERLNAAPGLDGWLERVDLIAGSSTGALIALGLAMGLDIRTLRALYETRGERIFDDSWVDDLADLGTFVGADYGTEGLEKALKETFGETTLSGLGRRVLSPTFDLDNEDEAPERRTWKPKLFHNFPGRDSDGAFPAYQVGLYACAAPTYFPSVDGYIDGGVFANNPSMCALAQSQGLPRSRRPDLGRTLLFSLGSGTALTFIPGKRLDWGLAQCARHLVDLMMDVVMGIALPPPGPGLSPRAVLSLRRSGPGGRPGALRRSPRPFRRRPLAENPVDAAGVSRKEAIFGFTFLRKRPIESKGDSGLRLPPDHRIEPNGQSPWIPPTPCSTAESSSPTSST